VLNKKCTLYTTVKGMPALVQCEMCASSLNGRSTDASLLVASASAHGVFTKRTKKASAGPNGRKKCLRRAQRSRRRRNGREEELRRRPQRTQKLHPTDGVSVTRRCHQYKTRRIVRGVKSEPSEETKKEAFFDASASLTFR